MGDKILIRENLHKAGLINGEVLTVSGLEPDGRMATLEGKTSIHRSKLIRQYVVGLQGKIWLERLPAYAPELNPVEYLWSYWKQHELPNLCALDLWQLSGWAAHGLRRIRRKRDRLLIAFWKQAELSP